MHAVVVPPVAWPYVSAPSGGGHPWPSKGARASVRPWYSCGRAGASNVPLTVPGPSHARAVITPPCACPYASALPGGGHSWPSKGCTGVGAAMALLRPLWRVSVTSAGERTVYSPWPIPRACGHQSAPCVFVCLHPPGMSNPWPPNDGMSLARHWYSLGRAASYPLRWSANIPRTVPGPYHVGHTV